MRRACQHAPDHLYPRASGARTLVVFMVNESDHSSKDDATIERYVREKLGAGGAGFNLACMTFNEETLYPLDQGLNKVRDMQKCLPALPCEEALAQPRNCTVRRQRSTSWSASSAVADCGELARAACRLSHADAHIAQCMSAGCNGVHE